MKKNRILYFLLLMLIIIYNIIISDYISVLMLYVLLFIPIISLLHIVLSYVSIKYNHYIDQKNVVKGDMINYTIEIINNNRLLLYCPMNIYLSHEKLLVNKEFESDFFVLFPRETKKFKIPIHCKYRGNYNIGVSTIVIMDYFGLIKIKYKNIKNIKVLVYPNIEILNYFPVKSIEYEDIQLFNHNIFGEKTNIHDIRSYQKGDPLKLIHWKLSAKKGELLVKDFSSNNHKKVCILIDCKRLTKNEDENIIIEDLLIESVVAIIYYLLSKRESVQLIYELDQLVDKQAINIESWDIIYEDLARLSFIGNRSIEELLDINYNKLITNQCSTVVIATSELTEQLYISTLKLKRQGYDVHIMTIGNSKNQLFKKIMNQCLLEQIKVYQLSQEKKLQSIIEGVFHDIKI